MIVNNNNIANNKGLLVVLSGPSGAGKGTVLKNALAKYSSLRCSISVTTRKMRDGEAEGINYFYKTVDEFKDLAARGAFLEWEEVYGNYYGTLIEHVDSMRDRGIDVVLEIDTKGALNVNSKREDAVMIFLVPRDRATLAGRLIGRGTETESDLANRLAAAQAEIDMARKYDYIVVNDNISRCADDILSIINAEKCSTKKCLKFIDKFN